MGMFSPQKGGFTRDSMIEYVGALAQQSQFALRGEERVTSLETMIAGEREARAASDEAFRASQRAALDSATAPPPAPPVAAPAAPAPTINQSQSPAASAKSGPVVDVGSGAAGNASELASSSRTSRARSALLIPMSSGRSVTGLSIPTG